MTLHEKKCSIEAMFGLPKLTFNLFKSTSRREREAVVLPSHQETLTIQAANQLATDIISCLRVPFFPSDFIAFLKYQNGSTQLLVTTDPDLGYLDTFEKFLTAHIRAVGLSPETLSDFLDFFAAFHVQVLNLPHNAFPPYVDQAQENIRRVNQCLEHNAVNFRIVYDSQYIFAVHKQDSEVIQANAIDPAFSLLRNDEMGLFKETIKAYEQALRDKAKGKYTDAVRNASHAMESFVKAALEYFKIDFKKEKQGNQLIRLLVKEAKILPARSEDCFQNLNNVLENLLQGPITIRNQEHGAGHGKPLNPIETNEVTAELAINYVGSNLLFLSKRFYERIKS